MIRFILLLLLLLALLGGAILFSALRIPADLAESGTRQQNQVSALTAKIEQQGVPKFLGDKFADVLSGEVRLDEAEFNALLLASLRDHPDGRRLLAVSDVVYAELKNQRIEVGAVINFAKVKKADARSREAIQRLLKVLPFAADETIYLAVEAQPIVREGGLAISDNLSLRVGSIPIPNALLVRAGLPLHKVEEESLALRRLALKSVTTRKNEIIFGVRPKF